MKKIVELSVIIMLLLTVGAPSLVAAADPVTIMVNGNKIDFPDAPAYIDNNGRTQVPSRFVAEALAGSVDWDAKNRMVSITKRNTSGNTWETIYLEFQINSADYSVKVGSNGKKEMHTMDTMAVLENSRTYIPVRYVAEALGAKVDWNAGTRTVTITSGEKTVGDFIVPDTFTEKANTIVDGPKSLGVSFTISFLKDLDTKMESVLGIMSQRIGQETIEKIRKYAQDNRVHEAKSWDDDKRVHFLDSESGRYVTVVRIAGIVSTDGGFKISIYNKGIPHE